MFGQYSENYRRDSYLTYACVRIISQIEFNLQIVFPDINCIVKLKFKDMMYVLKRFFQIQIQKPTLVFDLINF